MITRAQMPRQLRNKGGITNAVPREKYGLGSKIKERFRKLIPNELADIAVKAAPFVAPFNPGIAGLMRGIGRFDQRGSISDALKQGALTYGGGQAVRMLGGAGFQRGLGTPGDRFTTPLSDKRSQAMKGLFEKKPEDLLKDKKDKPGFLRKASEETIGRVPVLKNLSPKVQEKLLAGTITSGASALYSYFAGEFEPQEPGETLGEYMARRKERVKSQMRQVMDSYYTPLRNPSYAAMSDEEKNNFIDGIVGQTELEGTTDYQGMATGGRVELQQGGIMPRLNELGTRVSSAEETLQDINRRLESANTTLGNGGQLTQLPASGTLASTKDPVTGGGQPFFMGNMDPSSADLSKPLGGTFDGQQFDSVKSAYDYAVKSAADQRAGGFMGRMVLPGEMGFEGFSDLFNRQNDPNAPPLMAALGGQGGGMGSRLQTALGLAKGGMPTGIMRTNKAGVMERDYRDKGGFVPVGIKEKADDVPAMLSKNEFVFTADAVRGAGNGSIEKGAQRMYNTMKNLEKRVV